MRHFLWAAAAALALPSAAPAAEPPPPLPLEALAELPFISDPVVSPDGKKILARVNESGRESLAVYDLGAPADTAPHLVPIAGRPRWFSWAGNDRILVGRRLFGFIIGPFFAIEMTQLSRYDLKTKQTLQLGQGGGLIRDNVIFTDPDGRFVLISAPKDFDDSPSVSRVDLATGAAVEVQKKKSDISSWFVDAAGNIRGGIAYSGKNWTIHIRDPQTGEFRKGASGRISEKESVVEKIGLMAGGEAGFIITNEPTGRFAVYEYDLKAQAIGAPIFEHPQVDITAPEVSADGSRIEAVYYEDEMPRVAWLTPERQKLQAQIDKALPGKINRVVSESRDGNVAFIWSGSADDPGSYYAFDRKARRMALFATPFEKLSEQKLSPVKPVRYSARDGLSIPGYLTLPAGRDPKSLPLIVMPHGGPFARDSYAFNPLVQLLASRGYAVLQPNFRGSTGYGRDYVSRGYGQWGTGMQDDLDDGVAWLASEGTIDPKRVCIFGWSYGGYAAMWAAVRNPEIYRCAISMAGISDVRAMLKYDSKVLVAGRYSKQWRKQVEGEEKRDLSAISPFQQAARLSIPIMIAHGDQDTNVPAEQSRKLVTALKARGAPVQSAFYPGAGHDFDRTADNLDFMKRVEAFLEIHNPAGPAPKGPREAEFVAGVPMGTEVLGDKKAPRPAVELRYLVTADGRVTSCSVTSSSGTGSVDKEACRLAEERLQYRPALAADGARQESWKTRSIPLAPPAKK